MRRFSRRVADATPFLQTTRALTLRDTPSNVGSKHFRKLRNPLGGLSTEIAAEQVQADVRRDVERRFSPEFLNRIDEVVVEA